MGGDSCAMFYDVTNIPRRELRCYRLIAHAGGVTGEPSPIFEYTRYYVLGEGEDAAMGGVSEHPSYESGNCSSEWSGIVGVGSVDDTRVLTRLFMSCAHS